MDILGKKGGKGGGGGSSFHEDPNNLKSVSTAKVLDLISEGEIVGLVNGMKSIYLDNVPLQNDDDTYNFNGVSVDFRTGTPDQEYLPGFSNVETFYGVNEEVKYGLPITHSFTDENADAVIITMSIPALSQTDTGSGSILAYEVHFSVEIRADGGTWYNSGDIGIYGKCVSEFQRSYYFPLPVSETGVYEIRVTRISPDADTATRNNRTVWFGFTRVVESKLNYSNRAVCGITVRADQFGSTVPNRAYEIYGLIVKVPSNYDAWNHTYDSEIWDGTFKRSWTNNPAWIFYDLVTNGRYGLGREILPEYIDKYGLYMIGRYCDELVSDGHGGTEPRFTFNGCITTQESAYSLLNNLAGAFNSMIYYSGSSITLVQDSPKTPIRDFTPANVIAGQFTYEGTGRSARHSVFQVTWTNPESNYAADTESIENPDMIQDIGWKTNEITLLGCTSRAQARRRALRDIYTEQHETETVSFSVTVENADIAPGDIIRIADPSYAGYRYGGRIVSVNSAINSITLDSKVDFSSADNWKISFCLPNNTWIEVAIYTPVGTTDIVKLVNKLEEYPLVGGVWALSSDTVEPRLFRVLSIKEEKPYQFTITALLHYNQKYDIIEKGAEFVEGSFTGIPTGPIKAPINLSAKQYMHRVGDAVEISIIASWQSNDPRATMFLVRYQQPGVNIWTELGYTSSETSTINNTGEGIYQIQVQAIDGLGRKSQWTSISYDAPGYNLIPSNVLNLTYRISSALGILWSWDNVNDFDLKHYIFNASNESGDLIVSANEYRTTPYNFIGTLTAKVWAENLAGNRSENPATNSVEIIPPKTPVVISAKLLNSGIVAEWTAAFSMFDIYIYRISSCADTDIQLTSNKSITFAKPSTWLKDSTLKVQAQDIFKNWGEYSEELPITWYAPKSPKTAISFNKLTGAIILDWQDCRNDTVEDSPEIKYYEISGTLANQSSLSQIVSVVGTHYEAVVPLTAYEYGSQEENGVLINVGTLYIEVTAVDKYGITNKDDPNYVDNTVSISIYPPYNPTEMALGSNDEGSSIVLSWKDCTRTFAIDYYLVTDVVNNQVYKVSTNYVVLPARKEGTYKITVQAFDVIGHSSAAMEYNMIVSGVGGMIVTAKVDGSDILLEWSIPDSSFIIDHYIIKGDNDIIPDEDNINFEDGDTIGTAKVNYFRVPAGLAGNYNFYIWAVDVAGNISSNYASYTSINIDEPNAPSVLAALDGDGVTLKWSSVIGETQLPIRAWDIVRQWNEEVSEGVFETKEMDYGRLDVDTTNVPAFIAGNHTFMVRAIDSGGNIGPWGYVDFTARKPGKVTFNQPTVIDNNVQLYWTDPNYVFFPIKEYIFSEIEQHDDGSEYEAEIGRVDALFASETESVAGMFTYAITPVDVGGNIGERATITCRVAQPPDFVFYDKKESLFNGEKVNFILNGKGSMLGPVPIDETWLENANRVIEIAGLSATEETLTHQQKIDAGYKTWLEPVENVGTYTETIDHGTIIPSCNYTITMGYRALSGNPIVECKIEISEDGEHWETASDNAFSVFVTQFQYSRFTITVTGGYIEITSILVDLNIKQLTDYGRVVCRADDNGEGWISEQETPMLTGTWVPFKRDFVDVQSLPKPNVINQQDYEAFTVFEDVINPKGFRVFVKDKNGNRVTATVDWTAMGV